MNTNQFHCTLDLLKHGFARLNIIDPGYNHSLVIDHTAYVCASKLAPYADDPEFPPCLLVVHAILLNHLEALNALPDAQYEVYYVMGVLWNRTLKEQLDAFFAAGRKASS